MLKRFFPFLMLALLGWAASPVAAQEEAEACSWIHTVCANSCSPSYNVCLNAGGGMWTCIDQWEACMDSCYGDFWCGYRQV